MATIEFRPERVFKTNSQGYAIARRLYNGQTREEVMRALAPRVGTDRHFTFYENIRGRRGRPSPGVDSTPKPLEDQFRLFIWAVDKVIKEMVSEGWANPETVADRRRWSSKERTWVNFRNRFARELMREAQSPRSGELEPPKIPEPGTVSPVIEGQEKQEESGEVVEPALEPVPLPDNEYDERGNLVKEYYHEDEDKQVIAFEIYEPPPYSRADDIDFFFKVMMRARDFLISRELSGEFLDFVSTRAIKDGAKAIAHGVRPDEVILAVTKTWPDDSKQEFARHSREWQARERLINPEYYEDERILPGAHGYMGYVLRLADARIPIFLVGPSGCGKSFLARDLAEALDVNYGEIPLTAGATPSWLVGAETISGYKTRPFVEIYENGGVFCFEEIDAADPNMLLLVNNALANEVLTNPVTGKEIEKSSDFIPVATANTWGLGSNRQYTGRERLDAATLDRWRIGRIEMDYDPDVEMAIIEYWKEEADKLSHPRKAKPIKAVKK